MMRSRKFLFVSVPVRVLLMLGLVLLWALIPPVVLQLFVGTAFFRRTVSEQLSATFAGTWEIGEVRLSADPRVLEVYGVTIADPLGNEVVRVQSLQATIDYSALFANEFRVARVDLDGADVQLTWDDRGHFGLADAFGTGPGREEGEAEPASGDPFTVTIDDVNLTHGHALLTFPLFTLDFRDLKVHGFRLGVADILTMEAAQVTCPDADVRFKPELFGFSSVPQPPEVNGGEPIAARADFHLPVGGVSVTNWVWTDNAFVADDVKFSSEGSTFKVTEGMMDFREAAGFAYGGHLIASLPPHPASIEYFTGPLLGSPINLELAAHGFLTSELNTGASIQVGLDLDAADLEILGMRFERAGLHAELVNRRLYLTELNVEGYGGKVGLWPGAEGPLPLWESERPEPSKVAGRAFLNLLDLQYDAPLRVRDLDVRALLDDAVAVMPERVLPALTGRLDADVRLSGRLVDVDEDVRFASMPAYHRFEIGGLTLLRPARVANAPIGLVPGRKIVLSGSALLTEGHLRLEDRAVLALNADVLNLERLELDLDDPAQPLSASFDLRVADVGAYLAAAGVANIHGRASSHIDLDGPMLNPRVSSGVLSVRDVRVGGLEATDLNVRFSLADGRLTFPRATTHGAFGALTARGSIDLFAERLDEPYPMPRLDLRADVESVDLAVLAEMLQLSVPMSGRASVSDVRIRGPASAPSVSGAVDAEEIVLFDEPLDYVRGKVTLDKGTFRADAIDLRHGSGARLRADGYWLRGGKLHARVTLRDGKLDRIGALRRARVTGVVRHLELRADGTLKLGDLRSTGPPTTAGAATTSSGDLLRWLSTEELDLSGTTGVWSLALDHRRLGGIAASWRTLDRRTYTEGAGEVDDEDCPGNRVLVLSGSWMPHIGAAPGGRAEAQSSSGPVGAPPAYVDINGCVPMDRDQDYLSAKIDFDALDLRGIVAEMLRPHLDAEKGGGAAGAEAELSGIQVAKVLAAHRLLQRGDVTVRRQRRARTELGPLAEAIALWGSTRVGGTVELELDRADMSYLAEARLRDLEVSGLDRTLRNTREVVLVFDGRRVAVDSLTLGTGAGRVVDLSGAITLGDPSLPEEERTGLVTLFVKGDVDLALLNFLPAAFVDVRGVAHTDIAVTGPWDAVHTEGELVLSEKPDEQLRFGIRGTGQTMVVEQGAFVIDSDGVRIRPDKVLSIKTLGGSAQISGGLDMDNYAPGALTLKVQSDHMSYRIPDTANVTFSSDLVGTLVDLSDPTTWSVSGDVDIIEGRVTRDYFGIRDSTISRIFAAGGVSHAQRYQASVLDQAPFLKKINFDVTVRGRDSLLVQNIIEPFEVDIELATDLTFKNTLEDPQLYGTLRVLPGGRILYRGAEFTINTGDLAWEGEVANPRVQIFTETEVVNSCAASAQADSEQGLGEVGDTSQMQIYAISLSIEGAVKDIRWELSSSPYADLHDIYALLAVGCLADGVDSSADGAVTEMLLRSVLGTVEDRIKGIIGVDEVHLATDLDTYRIRLAEHITNRLIVGGQAAIGTDSNEHRGYLRYLFSDNVFVEGSEKTDSSGQFGVDLKLKWLVPLE